MNIIIFYVLINCYIVEIIFNECGLVSFAIDTWWLLAALLIYQSLESYILSLQRLVFSLNRIYTTPHVQASKASKQTHFWTVFFGKFGRGPRLLYVYLYLLCKFLNQRCIPKLCGNGWHSLLSISIKVTGWRKQTNIQIILFSDSCPQK